MLTSYIRAAMRQARYEIVEDDGSFYGDIPAIPGVWANAKTSRSAGRSWRVCCRDGCSSALPITPRFRTLTASALRSAKSLECLGLRAACGARQYMKGRGRKLRIPNPHTEDIGHGLLVPILPRWGRRFRLPSALILFPATSKTDVPQPK